MSQINVPRICIVIGILVVILVLFKFTSCADPRESAKFDKETGEHILEWINKHGSFFLEEVWTCNECHGDKLDGGIAKVGCYDNSFGGVACHGVLTFHGREWDNPDFHGARAKVEPTQDNGFESCQVCHGKDYSGIGVILSCYMTNCHVSGVPHTSAPWRIPGTARTHTNTHVGNAEACEQCHSGESPTPAPSKTPPDCFNNTLCHGVMDVHITGWNDPNLHGASAKAAPALDSGYVYCQVCHGKDFSGGTVLLPCYTSNCHGSGVPHSPAPWLPPGTARSHTNTNVGNAAVCAQCHAGASPTPAPSGTPPDCFNNTLCHGMSEAHPVGWETDHAPMAASNNTSCGTATCHGADFEGGAVGIGCFECHLGGPDPSPYIMHPNLWQDPDRDHRNYLKNLNKDASSCSPSRPGIAQYCHGYNLPNDPSVLAAPPNGAWPMDGTCYACHGKKWTVP